MFRKASPSTDIWLPISRRLQSHNDMDHGSDDCLFRVLCHFRVRDPN